MTKNSPFHRWNGHQKYHTNLLTFPWINKKILIRYSLCMNRAIEDVFIGRSKIEINLYAILGSFFALFHFPCAIQFHPIYRWYFFVFIVCPLIIAAQYCSSTQIDYHWLFTCHILLNVIKFLNFPISQFHFRSIFLWILTLYLSKYINALCKRN